jgi:hypothetical protein
MFLYIEIGIKDSIEWKMSTKVMQVKSLVRHQVTGASTEPGFFAQFSLCCAVPGVCVLRAAYVLCSLLSSERNTHEDVFDIRLSVNVSKLYTTTHTECHMRVCCFYSKR